MRTKQELADAKSYLTGVIPLKLEGYKGIAGALLESYLFRLGDDFITRYPVIISPVTGAEIQAGAQKYLSSDVYVVALLGHIKRRH